MHKLGQPEDEQQPTTTDVFTKEYNNPIASETPRRPVVC